MQQLCAVTALVILGILAGCRPEAESSPMYVSVEVSRDGYVVSVALCDGDRIGGFGLTSETGAIESRWNTERNVQRRVALLVVDNLTARDGSFNPAEVRVVSRTGSLDTAHSSVFVSGRGFAEFDVPVPRPGSPLRYVVFGRSKPILATVEAEDLLKWQCG